MIAQPFQEDPIAEYVNVKEQDRRSVSSWNDGKMLMQRITIAYKKQNNSNPPSSSLRISFVAIMTQQRSGTPLESHRNANNDAVLRISHHQGTPEHDIETVASCLLMVPAARLDLLSSIRRRLRRRHHRSFSE